MRKKIKNLTLEECSKICLKSICKTCPLLHFSPDDDDIKDCPCYDDEYLEKEIEIDE